MNGGIPKSRKTQKRTRTISRHLDRASLVNEGFIAVYSMPSILVARVTGNPTRVTGNPARVAGNPVRVTGNPVPVTGNPARLTSNPARVTGNPERSRLLHLDNAGSQWRRRICLSWLSACGVSHVMKTECCLYCVGRRYHQARSPHKNIYSPRTCSARLDKSPLISVSSSDIYSVLTVFRKTQLSFILTCFDSVHCHRKNTTQSAKLHLTKLKLWWELIMREV